MSIRLALAALATVLVAPLPALACSPAPGYRVPTNIELTAEADLILLARVEDGTPPGDDFQAMHVSIRPIAALKGDIADAPTMLPIGLASGEWAVPSNPYELQHAHPIAYMGGCFRYMVPRGSRLLFFLARRDGQWGPAGGPFSRWAEDVLTDDAPWLRAVRFYLDVHALPESRRADALAERRDALRSHTGDPVAQLLADDIDRQLAGPNEPLRAELPPAPENE